MKRIPTLCVKMKIMDMYETCVLDDPVFSNSLQIQGMDVEQLEEQKKPCLEDYLFLQDYQDVFIKELLGMPLKRVFYFCIDLAPGSIPSSKALYIMTTTKLMEMKA